MKDNKKILIILGALIIVILIIIISIIIILQTRKEEVNIDKEATSQISQSETDEDESEEYEYDEEESEPMKASGCPIIIEGMPNETKEKIQNYNNFEKKLEEYANENHIINYNEIDLKFIKEKQDGNKLKLKFELKDYQMTKIIAEIDQTTNIYEFFHYI